MALNHAKDIMDTNAVANSLILTSNCTCGDGCFRMEEYQSSSSIMTKENMEIPFLGLLQCNVHYLFLRWRLNK